MKIVHPREVAFRLSNGEIGVLPTDTVYGIVALASHEPAVERFYGLKNRDQKPGTLIASDVEQLLELGVPRSEIDKVSQWWPNSISAVLRVIGNDHLHQGVGTLAMRVVDHPNILPIIEHVGPIITSSANLPGESPAKNIEEAVSYFGDNVDFYIDGGLIDKISPSTIIRPTLGGIEILRQGSITP